MISWWSTKEITAESGLSSSSIHFAREELLAAGLISKAEGRARGGCDPLAVYKIHRKVENTEEARAMAKARRERQQRGTQRKHASEARRRQGVLDASVSDHAYYDEEE